MSNIVLGVETAIAGGSVALFRDEERIASWVGNEKLSGAEKILPAIDSLLTSVQADIRDVATVVVSTGPGSFTGIRVGIATVLGLKASTGLRCLGITAFQAISNSSNADRNAVALPMGRAMICLQQFVDRQAVSAPRLISHENLSGEISGLQGSPILTYDGIFGQVSALVAEKAVNIGTDIASFLCQAINSGCAGDDLRPLFVDRKAFTKI